jgi:hypothetical protein
MAPQTGMDVAKKSDGWDDGALSLLPAADGSSEVDRGGDGGGGSHRWRCGVPAAAGSGHRYAAAGAPALHGATAAPLLELQAGDGGLPAAAPAPALAPAAISRLFLEEDDGAVRLSPR